MILSHKVTNVWWKDDRLLLKVLACCFKANYIKAQVMPAVKCFRGKSAVKVKNTNKTEKKSAQTEEKRLADRFNIS